MQALSATVAPGRSRALYRRLTTASLAAVLMAISVPAVAGAARMPDLSDTNADRPLVLGRIVTPLPLDSTITAKVWPTNRQLAKMSRGDTVELTTLGDAIIYPDGVFAIWPNGSINRESYIDDSGNVNGELTILGGDFGASIPFTVNVTAFSDVKDLSQLAKQATPSVAQRFESSDISTPSKERVVENKAVQFSDEGIVLVSGQALKTGSVSVCGPNALPTGYHQLIRTKHDRVVVGQSFSNTPNSDATFTYKTVQTSTFGVTGKSEGVVYANVGLTSGTFSSGTATFPIQSGAVNRFYKTEFKIQEWKVQCERTGPGSPVFWYAYEYRPTVRYGGAQIVTTSNTGNAHHCSSYIQGGGETAKGGTAITWTNGVSLNAFGITVGASAKTGYTVRASIGYKAARGGLFLCGDVDGPGTNNNHVLSAAKTSAGY